MPDRIKGSNLPFINLSKENLRLIYDALEAEQAGKMMFALTEYIYDGIEPNFETKIEKSVWNNIIMLIDRKAESYFKKATANRENGKKGGRPKKNNDFQKSDFKASTSHDNDIDDTNYQNTIESASEAKEIGNTGILQDTELIGTLKNEQFEVMKGKTTIEIEEQDLTNEEIVKRASNDFVNHYKIDAYNLWVEMNDRYSNGESYQNLWEKWVDMWRPFICTDRRIELQGDITNTVVNRYGKRYSKELKERQSDTTTVEKSNADPQNEVLNDSFDNYSEDLNNFLDENEQRINGWVNAITNGIVYKTNITEFPKEMAIKNIEKIITDLGTDTKEALDFKEYMTEIITDSIRRKRYEKEII